MPQGAGEATRGLCQVGSRERLAQKIGSSRLKNIIKMIFYLEVGNTVIGYRGSFKINWEIKRVQYGLMMKTCIIKGGGLPLAPIHLVSPPTTPHMPWEVGLDISCWSRWVWCLHLMSKKTWSVYSPVARRPKNPALTKAPWSPTFTTQKSFDLPNTTHEAMKKKKAQTEEKIVSTACQGWWRRSGRLLDYDFNCMIWYRSYLGTPSECRRRRGMEQRKPVQAVKL